MTVNERLEQKIEEILSYPTKGLGVDILILSHSSQTQASYWEKKLFAARGRVIKHDAVVLSIHEDWTGGAGNAFGTLYAFSEANRRHEAEFGATLFQELERGKCIAIYHTAGKGTRLAPLSLAEYNNKPGVELPAFTPNDPDLVPLTALEMVIKQTAPLSHYHHGRVLVFWSDQLFIPSAPLQGPKNHVEIFAKHIDPPSKEEWDRRDLSQYGLIAFNRAKRAVLINKISYATYQGLINHGVIDPSLGLSLSLGSFSLSPSLLKALLAEFAQELGNRHGQLDADPALWMPITLDEEVYLPLMREKGYSEEAAKGYWRRVGPIKEHFREHLFSLQEIGQESYWWDLGNCRSYYINTMKLLEPTAEGYHLRLLFGYLGLKGKNQFDKCQIDSSSLIVDTRLKRCRISQSILVGLEAKDIQLSRSIVIGGQLQGNKGSDSLLYHVYSPINDMSAPFSQIVRADLFYPPHEEPVAFYTLFSYDGHKVFEEHLPNNIRSFQDQYEINQSLQLDEARQFAHDRVHTILTK